jgi:pimeloyl-ACP methyl ester carboxylesterase
MMPRAIAIEQHVLWAGRARIFYEAAGSGQPLVVLHGLSGSTRWWRYNVPCLARRARVHLVDMLGFGGSRGQRFVLREAADTLARWMDRLGLERADLMGHSMGGFVAADLAARFPERVRRLVLVDAAALPFERGYVRHAWGLVRALRYASPNFLPLLAADAARAGAFTVARAAREVLSSDMTGRLAHIQAPTLVVWGEHDVLLPPAIGQRLCGQLAHSRFVAIRGAGHNPMWDRPARFNRAVSAFLFGRHGEPAANGRGCGPGRRAEAGLLR